MIMTKVILAIAMWHASLSGADTPAGDLQTGNEIQFYSTELINSSIAGVHQEQLNNKYAGNMNHEIREHVIFLYTRYPASTIISPRDAASGLPTGKRQHKPFSAGSHNDLTLDDTAGHER